MKNEEDNEHVERVTYLVTVYTCAHVYIHTSPEQWLCVCSVSRHRMSRKRNNGAKKGSVLLIEPLLDNIHYPVAIREVRC